MIADFIHQLAELCREPPHYNLDLALTTHHGRSFTIDTWRAISQLAPQLRSSANYWFPVHGQHLPLHIWREFVDPQVCLNHYPFTAAEIELWPDHRDLITMTRLHQNANLQLCAVQFIMRLYATEWPHLNIQFHWRVYQRYWRELDPPARKMFVAFNWANEGHELDAFPIEVVDRYLAGYPGDERILCTSRSITVDEILQRPNVRWQHQSFIERDDYTMAQYVEFARHVDRRELTIWVREMIARNCRAPIDELCALHQAGALRMSCQIIRNRHHSAGDRYRHLQDKHPNEIESAMAPFERFSLADYHQIIAIDPTHKEYLRRRLKCGADRLAVSVCELPEIMYLEMRELDVARVFALAVFHCDALIIFFESIRLAILLTTYGRAIIVCRPSCDGSR